MTDIRTLAAEAGLSLRALAARYEIPYRTAQDWATGRRNPPDYVINMLEALIRLQREED